MSESTTIVSPATGALPLQGESARHGGPSTLADLGLDFHRAAARLSKVVNRTPPYFQSQPLPEIRMPRLPETGRPADRPFLQTERSLQYDGLPTG